jgi:hypothetical protein
LPHDWEMLLHGFSQSVREANAPTKSQAQQFE